LTEVVNQLFCRNYQRFLSSDSDEVIQRKVTSSG